MTYYISFLLIVLVVALLPGKNKPVKEAEEIVPIACNNYPDFFDKTPQEGLMGALEYYNVKHPQIVYAQAVLETGNFKSNLCLNSNNLFGLYNSRKKQYYRFNHWAESVVAYLNYIQYRYKPPNDYYKFLSDIGYAEDPNYINKLKGIVSRNDKKNLK